MVMPMFSFNGSISGNAFQDFKNKYACGPIDYATYPRYMAYPLDIVGTVPTPPKKENFLVRFIKNCIKD